MTDIPKERREELRDAMDELPAGEVVDETGTIYPRGMTYGELRALLDMADERDRFKVKLQQAEADNARLRAELKSEQGRTAWWRSRFSHPSPQQPEDALAALDAVALPCDVGVPINGTILKGCKLRTLLIALERRGMSTAPRDALRLASTGDKTMEGWGR